MQPNDPAAGRPLRRAHPHHPTPFPAFAGADPNLDPRFDAAPISAPLHLAAPALLIEARFGDVPLATRLIRADEPGAFTIGAARGADAPVNPAWLSAPAAGEAPGHRLVERTEGGFAVNLTPAMRAELCTPVQRLTLPPDHGHAEAPLALPGGSSLLIPCGEVTFELQAAEPAPAVPRPWLSSRWRDGIGYPLGVVFALLMLVAAAHFAAVDPRALSLDGLGAAHRYDRFISVPLDLTVPSIEKALGLQQAAGGPSAPAAAKPTGQAGSKKAPDADRRLAIKGLATPTTAVEAAALVRRNPMLALLDGVRTGALADVMADRSALGADTMDAMGHLVGSTIGEAYGVGGLSSLGTGEGGGGTHEGMIGGGGLGTIGRYAGGTGTGRDYGNGVGRLGRHTTRVPDPLIGNATVRGSLDKEIIRRIVRRHINEVRYCYDQALAAHPSLEGRVVTQFTIAPTGRVLASVLASSTLGSAAVESCVVNAVKRWEFPEPQGGGLVIVSYPFQFSPAGG
jgi:TonB family protein